MNATRVSRACATAAVLAVLTTTGCQSESPPAALGVPAGFWHLPPETIKATMLKAVRAEPYVTMAGYIYIGKDELHVSSVMDRRDNCRADVRTPDGSFKAVRFDDEFYYKFGDKALRHLAGEGETADAVFAKLRGRWVRTDGSEGSDAFCKRSTIVATVMEGLSENLTTEGTEFVKQGETVVLSGRGTDGALDASVALESPHLLYSVSDGGRDRIHFTYDDGSPITKPRPRDIVEIPGLDADALPV